MRARCSGRACDGRARTRTRAQCHLIYPISDPRALPVDVVDAQGFTLFAPFTDDSSRWYDLPYVNVHDGRTYRLAPHGKRLPSEAQAQTYGEVVRRYPHHPEARVWPQMGLRVALIPTDYFNGRQLRQVNFVASGKRRIDGGSRAKTSVC